MTVKDISGHRFGSLLVVNRSGSTTGGTAKWECLCDCGNVRVVPGTDLRAGRRRSCGCKSPKFTSERVKTHGMSRSRTYVIWAGMRARCGAYSSGKSKRLYADKGVKVCERWEVFENFLADMGEAPDGKSLDRVDGSNGYSPENCRWATPMEQANNMSANRPITFEGQKKNVSEWARVLGMKPNTLLYRLRRGADPVDALTKPIQKRGRT